MTVVIRQPTAIQRNEIRLLLTATIQDTFTREGIAESHRNDCELEIATAYAVLDALYRGDSHFLIALSDNQIIGTVGIGEPNEIIRRHLPELTETTLEIKCVYVHPEYQRQGVGRALFNAAVNALRDIKGERFCLDSGYRGAQTYWRGLLGDPAVVLRDRYGPGAHHMIWRGELME